MRKELRPLRPLYPAWLGYNSGMLWVAWKMLIGNRVKYLGIVFGVMFAALLIAQQSSIFCGLMSLTVSQIRDVEGPGIWVMDKNVQFVDDIKPLADTCLFRVKGVSGVEWAVRFYKGLARARMEEGDYHQMILLGMDDATLVGAPEGVFMGSIADLRKPDAVIMDDAGYQLIWPGEPFRLGRVFEMNDRRAVLVGITKARRTFQSFPIIYTRYSQAVLFAPPERKVLSFVLAQPQRLKLYRLSDVIPDREKLHRTRFFRDFLAPGGWHHLAVALDWRGRSVRSEVALRRTQAQGDFTAGEIATLRELHPHIEKALNRLLAEEEERARRRQLEQFNHHLPFALMLLDWELKPVFINQRGYELCAAWVFGFEQARAYQARSVFHLPAELAAACRRLKADWLQHSSRASGPGAAASVQVAHPQAGTLTATLSLHGEDRRLAAKPGFAIYLQDIRATRGRSDPAHALLERLSRAERALVDELLQGCSNKEIARRLGKSTDTVKSQLTSIYRKLGVASRSQVLARLG